MSTKSFWYILLPLFLLGCLVKTPVVFRKNQKPISTYRLTEIRGMDDFNITSRGTAHWEEDGHGYAIDLGHITLRYIHPQTRVLSGTETLRYHKGIWARYMNERLGSVGIRVKKILLSIPGHLVVFRGFTALSRERIVDCLMHPNASKYGRGITYTAPDHFSTENMAVRELYESFDENQILIVDHFRDRNSEGDLGIVYVLQDISNFSKKKMAKYSFFGHIEHRHLFDNRCLTYQYIERVISPITVSLLPSCRFREFSPRGHSEIIPRAFLSDAVDVDLGESKSR